MTTRQWMGFVQYSNPSQPLFHHFSRLSFLPLESKEEKVKFTFHLFSHSLNIMGGRNLQIKKRTIKIQRRSKSYFSVRLSRRKTFFQYL